MAKRLKELFFDKLELLSIIFFLAGIFLFDISLNMVAFYGPEVQVPVFGGRLASAMSTFWIGFIMSAISFLLFSIRSLYKKKVFKRADIIFAVIGLIGLALLFAGGLLIYAGGDDLVIPFFTLNIQRIDMYHFGIFLEIITILYFALTK